MAPVAGVLLLVSLGAVSAWRVSSPSKPAPEAPVLAQPEPWLEPEVASAGSAIKSDEYRVLPGLLLVANSSADGDCLLAVLEARQTATSSHQLALLNPNTGRALWQRPIDTLTSDGGVRAVVNGSLMVADGKSLSALDPATGEIHWQRALDEPAEGLCVARKGVGVLDAKQVLRTFATATGASVSPPPARCETVYSSRSPAPNFAYVEGAELQRWLPKRSTLQALRGLMPQRGQARVVLGNDASTATRASVNVVANRRWLWQARLAPAESTPAKLLAPALAAVRLDRVVVPYVQGDDSVQLTAFNLGDGRRLWTHSLGSYDASARARPELLVSLDGHVLFLNEQSKLSALNLNTGTEEWSIGP